MKMAETTLQFIPLTITTHHKNMQAYKTTLANYGANTYCENGRTQKTKKKPF